MTVNRRRHAYPAQEEYEPHDNPVLLVIGILVILVILVVFLSSGRQPY